MTGPGGDDTLLRLQPGEKVLWRGRPRQGLLVRGGDYLVTPFAAAWLGFALWWEAGVVRQQPFDPLLVAWGVPFVALGVWLVGGRLAYDVWGRARTRYAVTDRRAIGVRTVFPAYYKSEELATVNPVGFERHVRGDATVAFGPMPVFLGPEVEYRRRREQQLRFERVLDGDQVYALIEQARAAAKAAALQLPVGTHAQP